MKYIYILFDLDGTLTDPFEGLSNAVIYSLEKLDVPLIPRSSIGRFIGPPLVWSYMNFCNLDRDKAELAVDYYREYYDDKGLYENRLYGGIEDALCTLKDKGAIVCVATSKPLPFANRVLEHFGLTKYIDHIEAVSFKNSEAEKKDLILGIIDKYNIIDKSTVVMIGDRKYDIEGAREAGITSIGILHGYGSVEEFKCSGATYIVKDTQELLKILIGG